ncbi:hypothetical protein BD410DRAFT_810704, partial [Rickenella mellea]
MSTPSPAKSKDVRLVFEGLVSAGRTLTSAENSTAEEKIMFAMTMSGFLKQIDRILPGLRDRSGLTKSLEDVKRWRTQVASVNMELDVHEARDDISVPAREPPRAEEVSEERASGEVPAIPQVADVACNATVFENIQRILAKVPRPGQDDEHPEEGNGNSNAEDELIKPPLQAGQKRGRESLPPSSVDSDEDRDDMPKGKVAKLQSTGMMRAVRNIPRKQKPSPGTPVWKEKEDILPGHSAMFPDGTRLYAHLTKKTEDGSPLLMHYVKSGVAYCERCKVMDADCLIIRTDDAVSAVSACWLCFNDKKRCSLVKKINNARESEEPAVIAVLSTITRQTDAGASGTGGSKAKPLRRQFCTLVDSEDEMSSTFDDELELLEEEEWSAKEKLDRAAAAILDAENVSRKARYVQDNAIQEYVKMSENMKTTFLARV